MLFILLSLFGTTWALDNPVLLVHGATRGGDILRIGKIPVAHYWQNVIPIFEKHKISVYVPAIPMDVSRAERAKFLQKFIAEKIGDKKFHIVAHSLGGTDARYLLTHLKQKNVLSLTTVASPHRGTVMADYFWKAFQKKSLWYYLPRLLNFKMESLGFLPELTVEAMEKFNVETPDRKDVKYFSVIAEASPVLTEMSAALWPLDFFVQNGSEDITQGISDGVVPLSSQPWGKVLMHLNLDHLGQINMHVFRYPKQQVAVKMYNNIIGALEVVEGESKN